MERKNHSNKSINSCQIKQGSWWKQKWRRTAIEEGPCRCSVPVDRSHRRVSLQEVMETKIGYNRSDTDMFTIKQLVAVHYAFVSKTIIPIKTFPVSETTRIQQKAKISAVWSLRLVHFDSGVPFVASLKISLAIQSAFVCLRQLWSPSFYWVIYLTLAQIICFFRTAEVSVRLYQRGISERGWKFAKWRIFGS